ncbi:MAG TPA: di-trans,poly-cis-decaprenylcistransferase, partial [Balneola sp.]|nr:di-trans,poly-cis-decaprenylcistransferase [Balneola sp.]
QSRDRRFGKVGPSEDEKGLAARLLKNKNK